MNIAIIPARGGSKRIPRKNIKLFKGMPVISYAIQTARDSGIFSEIIVSTDDQEIAEVAESFGASVPWKRSRDLASDFSTTVEVMQDTVTKLSSTLKKLDNVCCIYPVTPLLRTNHLSRGLDTLKSGDWDYVISSVEASPSPERVFSLGVSKEILMRFPEHEVTRTQDLPVSFYDAGQFYWGKKSAWEHGLPLFTSNSTILELPRECAVDVDTIEDWHYAEMLFELNGKASL